MTEKQQAILWLDSFMKNKEPLVLIPKPLIRLMHDVLKNEEAVEPVESGIPGVLWCGACKCSVMREEGYIFKHCPWCGKKVKWDE